MRSARKVRTLSHLTVATCVAGVLAVVGCGDASTGTNTYWHGAGGAGGTGAAPPGTGGGSGSGTGTATPPPSSGTGTGSSEGSGPPGTGAGSSTGSGSGTSAPAPPPSLSVTPDDTAPKVDLLSSTSLNVAIPGSTYAGTLDLTITGLPSDVTATFDHPSVTLSPAGGAVKLTLSTLSSTASGSVPFAIVATVGSGSSSGQPTSAPVTLTVKPVITINIPVNVDMMQGSTGNPDKMAFGDYPIRIKAPANFPVTINFHNLDSTPHEIHAEQQQQGFPHGNGLIGQGQDDMPRDVTQSGTYDWHLHDEGDATTVGEIVIQ